MSLANWLRDAAELMNADEWDRARRSLILLLAPIEPFIAEEIWSRFGETESVHVQRWPTFDPAALVPYTIILPIQVNGKICGRVDTQPTAPEEVLLEIALGIPAVREALGGAQPSRVVYVPGRIMNLVR
jgi:leucyl-tRNA synthetase